MGNLRKEIESKFGISKRMSKLFPEGMSTDIHRAKHVKINTKKVKQDELMDVDECTVMLISDDIIYESVHVNTVIDSMIALEEDERFVKVLYESHEITNSHLALYNQAEVVFTVISRVEK